MLFIAGSLLRFLAFGLLVTLVDGLKFNFTDVQQCDPVTISFAGSNISTTPSSLSILPINSTAIVVPLQDLSVLSTGIALTFLPLAADSNFLASLDDSTGENLIATSDLIRVLASPTGNSSCLPATADEVPRRFTVVSDVSQCENMTINYDTSVVSKAPTVRLYNPKGVSILLNNTSDDPVAGSATYMMTFFRGFEIVLLIEDGISIRETSPLLTVGGDASSDKSCFSNLKSSNGTNTTSTTTSTTNGDTSTSVVSKTVIIGSATGGGVVFFIACSIVVFIVLDRRKRRMMQGSGFDPSLMEKGPDNEKGSPTMGIFVRPPSNEGIPNPFARLQDRDTVTNPIYTTNSFMSLTKSKKERGSMQSWAQVVPEDQRYSASVRAPSLSRVEAHPPPSASRLSLQSLDIEGMLNMATLQSENNSRSRNNSETINGLMLSSSSLVMPTPTFSRPEPSRRHLRSPSGVPVGPDSVAFSGFSVNPFDTRESVTGGFIQEPLRTGDSIRISGGSNGLPVSPRYVGPSSGIRNSAGRSSTDSRRSSSDWYGIAR